MRADAGHGLLKCQLIRRIAVRCVPAALVWSVLTEGSPASWVIGIPAVLGAAAAPLVLGPPRRWRLHVLGALRVAPVFAWQALSGGADVALRALHPQLPLAPSFARYRIRLPASSPARVMFVNTISLMPGTLSADLDGDELTLHVLDSRSSTVARLARIEEHVAMMFGADLSEDTPGPEGP